MERLDQCNVQNCGLCTFKFEDNEVIFAGNLVSSEVQEARHNPNWLYSDELAVAFHKLCYGYAGGVSPQLRAITRYDFSPSQESMANARHFGPSILSQLNAELNALNPKMPLELQKYIADYLTPYYHIAITVASSRLKPKPKPTRVSLSSDIWAHSVTFHGKLYISNLSSEKNNDSKLIYSAASSRPADIIYIARDPWGVKEVVVALRGDAVERVEEADTWWEAISISPNLGYMKGDNDGLKLRNLEFEANDGNTRIVWTTPQSLQQNIRVIRSRDDSSEIRFTPFVINGANVSGYSTAVSGDTLALQAHESESTSLSSSETHWLYLPLNSGEWISEVWLRIYQMRRATAFIFVLNNGRVHIMGEYPPPGTESQYTLDLILTASNEPTSFFIDLSKGLRAVGTCHRASEGKARLSLPSAKSCYPRSMFFERFYYSRATLEDVTQVLPCRIASVIVGAIFCYRNGTRASLGWVALNQLDAPVTVDTPGLWFLITKFGPGFPKITAICHSPPVTGGQEYFHVQWQGELEWWFSCRQWCFWSLMGMKHLVADSAQRIVGLDSR